MISLKVSNPDSVRINEQGNGVCFGIGGDGRRVFFAGPWSPPYGSPSLTHFSTRTKTKNPKIQSQNTTKQKLGPFDLSERKFKSQRNFKIG